MWGWHQRMSTSWIHISVKYILYMLFTLLCNICVEDHRLSVCVFALQLLFRGPTGLLDVLRMVWCKVKMSFFRSMYMSYTSGEKVSQCCDALWCYWQRKCIVSWQFFRRLQPYRLWNEFACVCACSLNSVWLVHLLGFKRITVGSPKVHDPTHTHLW